MDGSRTRAVLAILSLAASVIISGCGQPFIIPTAASCLRAGREHFHGPRPSISTLALLETRECENLACCDLKGAFSLLEQQVGAFASDSRRLLALAELADEIGRTVPSDSAEAILWSRDAAVYAVFCLAESKDGQGTTAICCAAQNVHNNAIARCLRLVQSSTGADQSQWPGRLGTAGIVPTSTVSLWTAMGIDTIQLAEDWRILGLKPLGLRPGLGAPVIAQHLLTDTERSLWKHFGPGDAVFAATAVIRPRGPVASWRDHPVELVLHDSVHEEVVDLSGKPFPLAADLTTPLIRRLNQRPMQNYEYCGAIDTDAYVTRAGAYALEPYQPGKIPFVLVEGLWSSPVYWIQMLDSLRADPRLRRSYQFWVVLYPSGYPLPVAALSLRRSLREIRQRFDPRGTDAALNQMVILGKSTGGQTSRMLVQPSGDALWNAVFSRPIDEINAPREVRDELAAMFFFEPESYIRRVIFATTAHRGNKLARHPGLRFGVGLIRRNNPLIAMHNLLREANEETVFQPFFQSRPPSSIDGIAAENPLLVALHNQPLIPEITYHSIIARINPGSPLEKSSDGLVAYESAHLDGAASEQIVTDDHRCEANPEFIAEVQRILLIHLNEVGGRQSGSDLLGKHG
jgi:hypothetical protein